MKALPIRQQIVETARSWIGTPFHHQGRLKGVGVDCAGLITEVARELNLAQINISDYGLQASPDIARAAAEKHCVVQIPIDKIQPGDVLFMKVDQLPQHFGIVTENGGELYFVHAFNKPTIYRVVENRLDGFWRSRIVAVYRFPGLSE